jgi:hypothetical protein
MPVLPVRALAHAAVAASAVLSGAHSVPPTSPSPRYELKFRVIDRAGHLVRPLDLQLLNIAAGTNVDLGQSTKCRVRSGRYNVAVWIATGSGSQSFTLADRIVRVTRNRTITLDARLGRRVRIRLDAPDAVDELIELAPIVNGNDWAFNPSIIADSIDGGTLAAPAYVVPMTSRLVRLYEYSVWEKKGNTISDPSPFRYDIIKVYRGGLPSHPAITVRRADLARVSLTVRATDRNQQATLELGPMGPSGPPLPLNAGTFLGATPAHLVSYRTPGYNWQPIVGLSSPSGEMRDFVLNMRPYGRGHFTERYFSAVLSPQLLNGPSASVENRRLGVSTWPLLGDPWHPDTSDEVTGMTGLLRLYSNHHLLTQAHLDMFGANLSARIPMARHWYVLHVDATRKPGAALSTQIHGVWRFYAHGTTNSAFFQAHLDAIRLLPGGLDLRNKAATGALTRVVMRVQKNGFPPTPVRLVRAYASANDGNSWHAVRVRALGSRYVFDVRDPRHAGFVSLRVYIRDAAGNSELLTVIHAYGVR